MDWIILITNSHGSFPVTVADPSGTKLKSHADVFKWFIENKLSEYKGVTKIEVMEVYQQCKEIV